jgi:hypothetical protein
MDRITLELEPAAWSNLDPLIGLKVAGFFVGLLPRCLAAGWLSREPEADDKLYKVFPMEVDFSEVTQDTLGYLYTLAVGVIGTIDGSPELAMYCWQPEEGRYIVNGINLLPYSRYEPLLSNVSGARVVGAGLKVFANEAPIETGGTAYGGWLPVTDLARMTLSAQVTEPAERILQAINEEMKVVTIGSKIRPGRKKSLPHTRASAHRKLSGLIRRLGAPPSHLTAADAQDSLRYRLTFKGVDGVTVRYSVLQSSVQEEFRQAFPTALFVDTDPYSDTNQVNEQASIASQDIMAPNDFFPAVVWRFNTVDDEYKNYSLRVESVVHLQCQPASLCPFMTHTATPDPNYTSLQIILGNTESFPIVTKGQSFKAFMSGVRQAVASIGKVAKIVVRGAEVAARF